MFALMLITAILLDIFGFLCLIITVVAGASIGETLSFIPDVLGFIFLGISSVSKGKKKFFRVKRSKQLVVATSRKSKIKFFLAFIGELTPFIGALPFWTLYVVSEAKNKNK